MPKGKLSPEGEVIARRYAVNARHDPDHDNDHHHNDHDHHHHDHSHSHGGLKHYHDEKINPPLGASLTLVVDRIAT